MKLTWIGHACFRIESGGDILLLDPYRDGSVPGLAPVREQAHRVLCSHEHGDHAGRETVTLLPAAEEKLRVEILDTWHDDAEGTLRGANKIFLIGDGTHTIAHLGDLGCRLTARQQEKLMGLDAILTPVGGFFTIDGYQAAELVKSLNPRVAIPMHYRAEAFGFDMIGAVSEFLGAMGGGQTLRSCEIDLKDTFENQVLVLTPRNAKA